MRSQAAVSDVFYPSIKHFALGRKERGAKWPYIFEISRKLLLFIASSYKKQINKNKFIQHVCSIFVFHTWQKSESFGLQQNQHSK